MGPSPPPRGRLARALKLREPTRSGAPRWLTAAMWPLGGLLLVLTAASLALGAAFGPLDLACLLLGASFLALPGADRLRDPRGRPAAALRLAGMLLFACGAVSLVAAVA